MVARVTIAQRAGQAFYAGRPGASKAKERWDAKTGSAVEGAQFSAPVISLRHANTLHPVEIIGLTSACDPVRPLRLGPALQIPWACSDGGRGDEIEDVHFE